MMLARGIMPKALGFTLIEVLVTMLLLSGGMLGFAALQGVSLKNNQKALQHSIATQLAYDLADRMRANHDPSGSPLAGPVYASLSPANAVQQPACIPMGAGTAGCPRDIMAQNDLFEWYQSATLNTQLPGVIASVVNAGATATGSTMYTITINWDSNRDGFVDTTLNGTDDYYRMSLYL
ncbi:type IV pilus modification protein PilV [Methylovulum psychrotolerans]|nr:type IV pilus modification protein PilV [Methylovulum psychrotolerans]